ncbi:MAG: RsmB/NOP family class I SAM-dependent RNA methyltransferase [Akkermansia sp.]
MTVTSSSQEMKLIKKLNLSEEEAAQLLKALATESSTGASASSSASRTALVLTPRTPPNYTPPIPVDPTIIPWGHAQIIALANTETSIKLGNHDDYQAGYYYPLDLSSVWETTPLSLLTPPQRCLDLCAAPGGKSILAQTRLTPQLHIANEIHPKRLGILRHNLAHCGYKHLYTQRLRPDQWATKTPACFDLILVDAPCSGQSLLAKNISNPGCFHSSTVNGNAKRQRGILLNALQALAHGGHILYTTCTYSPEENEKNMAYLLKRHDYLQALEVPLLASFRSNLVDFPCYRLLPISGLGAGGFTCLLKDTRQPQKLPDLPEELLAWPVAIN